MKRKTYAAIVACLVALVLLYHGAEGLARSGSPDDGEQPRVTHIGTLTLRTNQELVKVNENLRELNTRLKALQELLKSGNVHVVATVPGLKAPRSEADQGTATKDSGSSVRPAER